MLQRGAAGAARFDGEAHDENRREAGADEDGHGEHVHGIIGAGRRESRIARLAFDCAYSAQRAYFRMARGGEGGEFWHRMIQRLPFSHQGTDGDIKRLRVLLGEVFSLAGLRFSGKHAVLNLACGRADETGALAAALAPAEIGFYLGMDLRADAIEEAAKRWELPDGEIHFRAGNAAVIGRMEGLQEFDMVFIRHQNYWHEPLVWEGILEEALAALKDGGHLVCTSYFDLEHELMLASMRARGAKLLANVRHAKSRPLQDAEGKSVDRWVAVFGK